MSLVIFSTFSTGYGWFVVTFERSSCVALLCDVSPLPPLLSLFFSFFLQHLDYCPQPPFPSPSFSFRPQCGSFNSPCFITISICYIPIFLLFIGFFSFLLYGNGSSRTGDGFICNDMVRVHIFTLTIIAPEDRPTLHLPASLPTFFLSFFLSFLEPSLLVFPFLTTGCVRLSKPVGEGVIVVPVWK